jgi:hypothetical protein
VSLFLNALRTFYIRYQKGGPKDNDLYVVRLFILQFLIVTYAAVFAASKGGGTPQRVRPRLGQTAGSPRRRREDRRRPIRPNRGGRRRPSVHSFDLLKVANHGRGENIYRVRFHYVPPLGVQTFSNEQEQ